MRALHTNSVLHFTHGEPRKKYAMAHALCALRAQFSVSYATNQIRCEGVRGPNIFESTHALN